MLGNIHALRSWLEDYEERCVVAARNAGATWAQVGDAVDMARTNAERKFRDAVRRA